MPNKTNLFSHKIKITIPDLVFDVMHKKDKVCTVRLSRTNQTVDIKRYKFDRPIYPFPPNPTPYDINLFLESRVVPRERANIDEILKALGLSEYDTLAICRKTYGLMYDDYTWLHFEDQPFINYDDIKIRE